MKINLKYDLRTIYLSTFFIMLLLYGLNKVLFIGGLKLFYLTIPMLYSIYLFKYEFEITKEIRVLLFFVLALSISTINTLIFHEGGLHAVLMNLQRLYIVLLMLIPLYGFYIKDDKLFNIFLVIYAAEVSFANIYHYFFVYDFADRFEGTFGGSNEFAYMLVSLIYYVYYVFYRIPNIKLKWLFTIALILLHIVVLITLSRTAILGMFIFYFFASPYFHRHTEKWKKVMIVVAFLSVFLFALDSLGKTAELMIERFTGERGASSLGSRTFEMLAGINLLAEHPMSVLFGNGMSISGSEIFPDFYRGMGGLGTRIHNSYFAMIVENGLFSVLSFAYLMYFILKQVYFMKDDFKYVILGFTVFTISFLSTIYLLYFLPFWMALFMISAHINILNNKESENEKNY